jgi:hypothetical protein
LRGPSHVDDPQKVVLYDPSISSLNLGDEIISNGAKRHLAPLLDRSFTVSVSTHMPASAYLRHLRDADYKFVLGSNLLRGRMNGLFRQWDIHAANAHWVRPAVLLGVGWWQYGDEPNRYTKGLYRRVLSHEHVHSVRDSYTRDRLVDMGFANVAMTGCASMWDLTPEHCASIPTHKGTSVVTTLTDYNKSPTADSAVFGRLLSEYEEVHFWVQGYQDLAYLNSLALDRARIRVVHPSLHAFDRVLETPGIDYVGTRLHAGIRALQKGVRALTLAIDNRAREKNRDFGIHIASRDDTDQVGEWVTDGPETSLRIPTDEIARWKSQFGL